MSDARSAEEIAEAAGVPVEMIESGDEAAMEMMSTADDSDS